VVVVGPFVWMLLSSFKPEGEIRANPPTWLPNDPTLANYGSLFDRLDFPTYFTNSAVVAVLTTVGNLLFCSAAGYALAKLPFAGKKVLFGIVLGTLMVPSIVTIVPLFVLSSNLGLVNTVAGLVLPYLAQAFGVFLMRQFILSIPNDLLEAARIDGASELRIYWQVVLPLCRPALATLGILTFLASWNNFLWPLVAATTEDTYTLPVALALYAIGQNRTEYDILLAGAVVIVLPVLVVFILLQRHFVRGIATTGLK
jgi:multiple sugar transport system permease protein